MKNKTMLKAIAVLIAMISLTSTSPISDHQDQGHYFFIAMSGDYNNPTNYVSGIIYYPGVGSCSNYEYHHFEQRAKEAFQAHLKAHYKDSQLIRNPTVQIIKNPRFDTSVWLKSQAQVRERLTSWVADSNNETIHTRFNFSCSNLK